jgi:hypothetical protein
MPWTMTSSGMTDCHVNCSQCLHNTWKECLGIMHHFVGLNICNYTIIMKVVPPELQDVCQTHTMVIKIGFTDVFLFNIYVYLICI